MRADPRASSLCTSLRHKSGGVCALYHTGTYARTDLVCGIMCFYTPLRMPVIGYPALTFRVQDLTTFGVGDLAVSGSDEDEVMRRAESRGV